MLASEVEVVFGVRMCWCIVRVAAAAATRVEIAAMFANLGKCMACVLG